MYEYRTFPLFPRVTDGAHTPTIFLSLWFLSFVNYLINFSSESFISALELYLRKIINIRFSFLSAFFPKCKTQLTLTKTFPNKIVEILFASAYIYLTTQPIPTNSSPKTNSRGRNILWINLHVTYLFPFCLDQFLFGMIYFTRKFM